MARELVVRLGEEISRFGLTRLTRDRLYGRRKQVVVDDADEVCQQALLMGDGSALLPSGSTSLIYIDENFNAHQRTSLQAVGPDGEPLEEIPSTLDREVTLTGPIAASRVLEHQATAIYQLDPAELGPALAEALARGELYEVDFTWRKGYTTNPMFLLSNEHGTFAVVGEATGFEFIRPEMEYDEDDLEADFLADALDFGMF